MPNPSRTPTIDPNNLVANTLTHTEQFQELFLRLKLHLVLAGGIIESSNGNGVASAADNITLRAHVTLGLAGTGAWFVIRFPNLGGSVVRFLIAVNDNAAPYQAIQFRVGNATWNTDGTTSALPTIAAGFATTSTAVAAFHPFTDLRNLMWSSWLTANVGGAQNVDFLIKEAGVNTLSSGTCCYLALFANSDADGGGVGINRWGMFVSTSGMIVTQFTSTTPWNGVNSSGNATAPPEAASALWDFSAAWTGGLDQVSRENLQPILLGVDLAVGRSCGVWIDHYAIPASSVSGLWSDSSENGQASGFRRKNFNSIALYWPDGVDLE